MNWGKLNEMSAVTYTIVYKELLTHPVGATNVFKAKHNLLGTYYRIYSQNLIDD